MNRRSFLKSIATVCGAAVVCPGELLKNEPEWMKYARCFKPEHKIMLDKLRMASSGNIPYGIPYYFRGVPIHYQENLPT